jgi:DNA-binding transcriptional LysR family regulator
MDWNDLKIVLAIARAGSFLRAGALLRLSHTTVSRRLSALEKDLGVKLFERVDRALTPREVCLPFLSAAEAVEAQMYEVTHGVKTFDERPHGTVRIVTMPWILRHLLAPALPDFLTAFPGVSLQLIGDVRDRDYAHGRTDISLRFELQPRKGEMTRTVATLPYSLYGPVGYDGAELPTLMFWDEFSSFAPDRWHKARGDEPIIRANDAGVIYQAIRAGTGFGVIPDLLGASDAKLVRISGPEPEMRRTLKAHIHSDVMSLASMHTMIEWLAETLGKTGEPD